MRAMTAMRTTAATAATVARVLMALVAVSAAACDGIGRELVGKRDTDGKGGQKSVCVLAPSCEDEIADDLGALIPPLDLAPVDLAACNAELRACVPALDAIGVLTSQRCVAGFTGDTAALRLGSQVYDCAAVTVSVPAGRELPLELDRPELRNTALTIVSEEPAVVTLLYPRLSDVLITLDGPVTLRVLGPRSFRQVRIFATRRDGAQDEPRIELKNVDGADVSIGGDYEFFPGTIAVEDGALTNTRVQARRIELTAVSLSYSALESETIDTSNATMTFTTLAFVTGRLDGSTLDRANVLRCESLAIVTGMVSNARIEHCAGPVRVYGASISRAYLDGDMQGDHALFQDVVFGAHRKTDLLAWDSQVFTSNFCANASTVRLGASVFVLCPSCDPDNRLITCADSQAIRKIETSQCDAFIDPLECGGALPMRPKPPR